MTRLQALPDPEPRDVIDVALTMIDARAWGVRLRIVQLVRTEARAEGDGWARISYRDLAKRVGLAASNNGRLAQQTLKLMADHEWVLVRGERGIGTRPTAWRVNPNVTRWRGVPWVEPDRELRSLRLASAARPGASDAMVSGGGGLSDALYSASLRGSDPPLVTRYIAALEALVTRSPMPLARHKGGLSDALSIASLAAANGPVSPPLVVVGAEAPPPPVLQEEQEEVVELFVAEVEKHTGANVDRPSRLFDEARRLALTHPLPRLLEAVGAAPSYLGPPRVIQKHVPAWLAGGFRPAGAVPTASLDPRARLEVLQRQVAGYRENGFDPPESLLDQVEACENGLTAAATGARP